jgi:hypothetical protein
MPGSRTNQVTARHFVSTGTTDPPASHATQPVVSLNLRTPLGEVSLFTVIATLGAPLEVTAADLAIETFLPMDERSAARLGELSRTSGCGCSRRA